MNDSSDDRVIAATDDNFNAQVLQSAQPVLVDFWAPWCGPCKAVTPILREIAAEVPAVRVVQVNVDENPQSAQKFAVRAIPTLLLFKDGAVVGTKIGAASKSVLLEFIGQPAPQ